MAWIATIGRSLAGLDRRARLGLGLAMAAVVALPLAWSWRDAPGNWWEAASGRRPLYAATSWHYQLDRIDIDQMVRAEGDVLVSDFAQNEGRQPLTPEQVARLKVRPDGRRRIVISYMSIGEAEEFRFYWQPDWTTTNRQPWDVAENCAWPKAHMVRFWHDSWKDIMIRGPQAYLKRIIDAGFDGVYLDRIDVYGHQTEPGRDLREEMIAFVTELSAIAKRLKPGFLVIAQNAEDLLAERRYRRVIDGLGKEDLLFGEAGTGKRNRPREVGSALTLIRKLQWDWKPVFAVEYLETEAQIDKARAELRRLGMVATFQHRNLDGTDPTKPAQRKEQVHGTPEWIEAECKAKGRRWW